MIGPTLTHAVHLEPVFSYRLPGQSKFWRSRRWRACGLMCRRSRQRCSGISSLTSDARLGKAWRHSGVVAGTSVSLLGSAGSPSWDPCTLLGQNGAPHHTDERIFLQYPIVSPKAIPYIEIIYSCNIP
jgi:hypothetical protein